MGFALHPEAIQDVDEIHGYINRHNFNSANRVLEELLSAFHLLARFPHHGHRRLDLTSRPLRFKIVRHYLIAYVPDKDPIWILGVIDGRMNPRVIAAILREREDT
jgi:plasmid stabilization system protein ParE